MTAALSPPLRSRTARRLGAGPPTWVLAAALPFLVGALVVWPKRWLPVSDWALIELHTNDVFSHRPPLVGPFSRYGWNHPGPLLYYVLAIPYRITGADPRALLVGSAAIGAASAVWTARVMFQVGGRLVGALTTVGTCLLVAATPANFRVDPWNPRVIVLPLAALIATTWSVTCGRLRHLPAWVLLASFVAQTHVGTVPSVGVCAVAVVLSCRRTLVSALPAEDGDSTSYERRLLPILTAGALLVALWLPPLIRELSGPSNLAPLLRHFLDAPEPRASLRGVFTAAGHHLSLRGAWLHAEEPADPFVGAMTPTSPLRAVPTLVVWLGSVMLAARARSTPRTRFALVVGAALTAGLVSVGGVTGPLYPYLVESLRAPVMLMWVSTLWNLTLPARLIAPRRWAGWGRSKRIVGEALVASTAVAAALAGRSADPPLHQWTPAVATVAPPVVERVAPEIASVTPRGGCLGEVMAGLAARLEAHGSAVVVPSMFAVHYGPHRLARPNRSHLEVTVACSDQAAEVLRQGKSDPQTRLVVEYDPLTRGERARLEHLSTRLRQAMVDRAERWKRDLSRDADESFANFGGAEPLPPVAEDLGFADDILEEYRRLIDRDTYRTVVVVRDPRRRVQGD
ncbi:MAG: hypothetical protein KatS3mg008_2068 [Acidimicrobiales bacterium]|nr:MAG: hypothetical protein KatS3mg008_2068 [Acidimicrobiales bacterium]